MTPETRAWTEQLELLIDGGLSVEAATDRLMRERPAAYTAMMRSVGMPDSQIVARLGKVSAR